MGMRRFVTLTMLVIVLSGGVGIPTTYAARHAQAPAVVLRSPPTWLPHLRIEASADSPMSTGSGRRATAIILMHRRPTRLSAQALDVLFPSLNLSQGRWQSLASLGLLDVPDLPFSSPLLVSRKLGITKFGHLRVSWTTPRFFATLLAILR